MDKNKIDKKIDQILEIAPDALKDAFSKSLGYADPDWIRYKFQFLVNEHVPKDSSDPKSVEIYALLCETTKEEMKERMKKDGF